MPVTQEHIDTITREVAAIAPDVKGAKELADKANTALASLRSEIDTVKGAKALDPLFVNKVDTLAAEVETMQASLEAGKAVSARVDAVEAVLKRPGVAGGWAGEEDAKAAKEAFAHARERMAANGTLKNTTNVEADPAAYAEYCKNMTLYMRSRGELSGQPLAVQASLNTASDPDGGYLVPVTTSSRVIKKVYETSALRQFATVETIGGKELQIPRDEGEFGYGWIGETTAPTETSTSQFGESKIFAHEMYAEPRVTQTMLEDAGFDVEGWVGRKVGEKFGRIEATSFFTGNGVNQPKGLLTYAAGTTNGTIEQVVSGAAAALTLDGLYNLVFQLKDFYTANARFMMKRTTVRDVLKMKDGEGRPIWQMGDIKAGVPSNLLGYEVTRAEDMPAIEASALAIAFGDFAAAYTIVDRLGITMLRDNLTSKPFVKFYHRRRVGGDVVNFEAVKLLKVAAA